MNLNEDPFLTGQIKHILTEGPNVLGRRDDENPPKIVLGGLGIVKGHCNIVFDEDGRGATIRPNEEDAEKNKTIVNGDLVSEERQLQHGDRILFGNHNYFIFVDPQLEPLTEEQKDYYSATKEVNKKQMAEIGAENEKEDEERKAKLAEMEAKVRETEELKQKLEDQERMLKEQLDEEMRAREEEMKKEIESQVEEDKLKELQEELDRRRAEAEEQIKQRQQELKD